MNKLNFKHTKILKSIIRQPYCWPGGYERHAITSDGALVCSKCCKLEFKTILHSTLFKYQDGWQVAGTTNDSELESYNYCDHCNRIITEEIE